jgi:hypothetical protein
MSASTAIAPLPSHTWLHQHPPLKEPEPELGHNQPVQLVCSRYADVHLPPCW